MAAVALPYRTLSYSRWFVRGANVRGTAAGQHTAILRHRHTTYIHVPLASHDDFCAEVANAVQSAYDHPLGPGGIFETAEPCPALGVPCAFLYFDLRLDTRNMQREMTSAEMLHGSIELFKVMAQFTVNTLWTHWQQSGEYDRQARRRFIKSLTFVVSHIPELQRGGTQKRVRMVCRGLPVPAVFLVKLLEHMSTDANLNHMATLTLSTTLPKILESMIVVPRQFGMDMLMTEMPVSCPECGAKSNADVAAEGGCFLCQGERHVRGGPETAFQHSAVFGMDVHTADATFTARDIPSLSLAHIHTADLVAMHSIRPGLDLTSERPVWTLNRCPGRDDNEADVAAIDAMTWSNFVSAITLYVTTRLSKSERTSVQRRLRAQNQTAGEATLSVMSDTVFEARGQAMKRSFEDPEQSGWRKVQQDDGTPIWACAERLCMIGSSVWGKQAILGPGDTVLATSKRSLVTPCVLTDTDAPDTPDTRTIPEGALGFLRNYGVMWVCGGTTQSVPELMLPNTMLRPRGIGTLVRVQVPDPQEGGLEDSDTWNAVFRASATTGVISVVDRQGKTAHIAPTSCAMITVIRAAPFEGSEVVLTTDMQVEDTDLPEGTVGQVVRVWQVEENGQHQFHLDVEWTGGDDNLALKSTHMFDPFSDDSLPFEMTDLDHESERTSIPIGVNDVLVEAVASRKTIVQPSVSVHEPSGTPEMMYRREIVTSGTSGRVSMGNAGLASVLVVDWGSAHIREAIVMSSNVKGVVLSFTPLSVACLPIALNEVSAADRAKTPILYITCASHFCVNLIGSDVAFTRHTSARLRIAVMQTGLVPMCTCECQTQKHHRKYGMTCPDFAKHQKQQGVNGPAVRNAIRVSSSLQAAGDAESRALSDMMRREFRMLVDLFTPCATQDEAMRRLFASNGNAGRVAVDGGGGTIQFLNNMMSLAAVSGGGSVHSMLTPVMEGALGCVRVTDVRPSNGRNVRRRVGDAALHGFATSNTRKLMFSNAATGSHIELDMNTVSGVDPVEAVHRITRMMMGVMAERANGVPQFGGE